jgi:asparagine synthase (glutamine-hydrolysing)
MSLPSSYRINSKFGKYILRETFKNELPVELLNRPKHGFEVPLLRWFRTELKGLIENELLSESFIENQGLFQYRGINAMKKRLFSANPGDIEARIWGLVVFQYWWKKYML